MLFDLIEKYREVLLNSHQYVVCSQLLEKIGATIINNEVDGSELSFDDIINLSSEELSMFSSPESLRIIESLKVVSGKKGWRADTIIKLIKRLKEDIVDNKMKEFDKEKDSLDEIYKIVDEDLFLEKSDLILDLIKLSVDNELISFLDAAKLNFYVLNKSVSETISLNEDEIEVISLIENIESTEIVRNKISALFERYGYKYDASKMDYLDEKLVNYVDVEYLNYILSKFKEYGVSEKMLYSRRIAFCNIVLDNDMNSFNAILNFIDTNNCDLSTLLSVPAIFSKRKKNYVARQKSQGNTKRSASDEKNNSIVLSINGAYQDFFENVLLYKQLSGDIVFDNSDFLRLGKFLCTPNSLIRKNLKILEKYGIVKKGELPKAMISLCGNNVEYIIDRLIEVGLFEQYLLPRINSSGEEKTARGTYFLDGDNNPLKFYKMKRANDIGDTILATNGGIKKVFKDNDTLYAGIGLKRDNDGISIIQQPLSLKYIESIDPRVRKELPEVVTSKLISASSDDIAKIHFRLLYQYRINDSVDIFKHSDDRMITTLKGDQVKRVFDKDYKDAFSLEDLSSVINDKYIKLLDKAIYCDEKGNFVKVKKDDLTYEFRDFGDSKSKLIISRLKVLRLCKLLKENHCWLTKKSSGIEIENMLLSILLKDSIVCEMDVLNLKFLVKQILSNGLVKVSEIDENNNKRGAR